MRKLKRQALYELLNENIFRNDPRECLRLVRTLWPREYQVIEMAMMGRNNIETADELKLPLKTAMKYFKRARRKLGCPGVSKGKREFSSDNRWSIGRVWWSAMTLGIEWEKKWEVAESSGEV